jgi:hypothetical protein
MFRRWEADAGNYSYGRSRSFWFKSSALRFLRANESGYDRLILRDRWYNKKEVLRDRLKDALITQNPDGSVTIHYRQGKSLCE